MTMLLCDMPPPPPPSPPPPPRLPANEPENDSTTTGLPIAGSSVVKRARLLCFCRLANCM
ncbi:uncharacterized protein SETTUDRAFT_169553 [Exserohilum turcica Et28A]|uniref:Uncharacterized protein n=1 Tax=Exserohilum turcicum (strain 28A) TaxID=671987 RepID=R0ILS6_EXST2|nr:uncharacterized protein SETTUDRAFT_169553 [Exserohilum turcica Et28A]EOA85771.1 hypothetical protein SETTUDRAFT_169553 [Exserohilum turcica Et28A]